MITQSMTKLEGNPMAGLVDRSTIKGRDPFNQNSDRSDREN